MCAIENSLDRLYTNLELYQYTVIQKMRNKFIARAQKLMSLGTFKNAMLGAISLKYVK